MKMRIFVRAQVRALNFLIILKIKMLYPKSELLAKKWREYLLKCDLDPPPWRQIGILHIPLLTFLTYNFDIFEHQFWHFWPLFFFYIFDHLFWHFWPPILIFSSQCTFSDCIVYLGSEEFFEEFVRFSGLGTTHRRSWIPKVLIFVFIALFVDVLVLLSSNCLEYISFM